MKTEEKPLTASEISKKFTALPDSEKVKILYSAIGYMQQYNGRSVFYCIILAMGYDGDDNAYYNR